MNILLIAATEAEIAPLIEYIAPFRRGADSTKYAVGSVNITVLITGVGMVATAYNLTRELVKHQYDVVLQAGVGGSFNREIALGDVVLVSKDRFADMGAEDREVYIDIFDIGLLNGSEKPFIYTWLEMPDSQWIQHFPVWQVAGVTVNTVSGNEKSIARITGAYNPDVESMEGAAMHYVCLQEGVPFVQLRAVSNYVEPRDKSKWQMGKAIKSLNDALKTFVDRLK